MKVIFKVLKKVIMAFFLIYGFNMLYGTFNLNVPLNFYTVSITTILGFPGFCGILFVSKFV